MSNQQPTSTFLGIAAARVLSIAFAVMGGAGVTVQVTETLLDGNAASDFDARISGDNIVFTSDRNFYDRYYFNMHASSDFRRHLAKVLTEQALVTAFERAKKD